MHLPYYKTTLDHIKVFSLLQVTDIEEMAWAPKYGLKGMIDASIRVKIESKRNEINGMILPLEFKTGKIPNGQASIWYLQKFTLYGFP